MTGGNGLKIWSRVGTKENDQIGLFLYKKKVKRLLISTYER